MATIPVRRPAFLVPPLTWILPFSSVRRVDLDTLGAAILRQCDGTRTVHEIVAWFAAATALPLAGLGWFGWTLVAENRARESAALVERRERAADLASTALQRPLAEAEVRLTAFDGARADAGPTTAPPSALPSTVLAAFDRRGLVDRSGAALPFYPSATFPDTEPPAAFAVAERREFRERDPAGAIAALLPLAEASDAAVRGEALLRLARIHRRLGDVERAERAYRTLAGLEDTPAFAPLGDDEDDLEDFDDFEDFDEGEEEPAVSEEEEEPSEDELDGLDEDLGELADTLDLDIEKEIE